MSTLRVRIVSAIAIALLILPTAALAQQEVRLEPRRHLIIVLVGWIGAVSIVERVADLFAEIGPEALPSGVAVPDENGQASASPQSDGGDAPDPNAG